MAALMVVSKAAKLGVEMVETKAAGRAELKDKERVVLWVGKKDDKSAYLLADSKVVSTAVK